MTLPLMSSGLSHIDSHELARLATLWRLQALSGQQEACEIARAFMLEQRKRLQEPPVSFSIGAANALKVFSWRKLYQSIFRSNKQINLCQFPSDSIERRVN